MPPRLASLPTSAEEKIECSEILSSVTLPFSRNEVYWLFIKFPRRSRETLVCQTKFGEKLQSQNRFEQRRYKLVLGSTHPLRSKVCMETDIIRPFSVLATRTETKIIGDCWDVIFIGPIKYMPVVPFTSTLSATEGDKGQIGRVLAQIYKGLELDRITHGYCGRLCIRSADIAIFPFPFINPAWEYSFPFRPQFLIKT